MTFQGVGALMTPKNARTEARGILVQLAGGATKFQREALLIHGGQGKSVSTRDKIGIGPREGSRKAREFSACALLFFFFGEGVLPVIPTAGRCVPDRRLFQYTPDRLKFRERILE
jgi:hypothetical protein